MRDILEQYLTEFILGIFTAIITYVVRQQNKKINQQQAIKDGVQALLRDRLIQAHNHYMDKGFCPIYARESMVEMAKQYYNLGGNGVIPSLVERVMCFKV